mgnify:CR=1 FL=1
MFWNSFEFAIYGESVSDKSLKSPSNRLYIVDKDNNLYKIKYAFVHNHVTAGRLSEGDITSLLTTKNMNVMIAVENSGKIYFVKKDSSKVLTKPLQLQYYNEVNKIRKECMLDNNRNFLKERENFLVDKAIKEFCEEYRIYGE